MAKILPFQRPQRSFRTSTDFLRSPWAVSYTSTRSGPSWLTVIAGAAIAGMTLGTAIAVHITGHFPPRYEAKSAPATDWRRL
jgi:hypothetical protein